MTKINTPTNNRTSTPNDRDLEQSDVGVPTKRSRANLATILLLVGLAVVVIGGASRLLWPSNEPAGATGSSSTAVPGTSKPAGAIDNSAPSGQPVQTVPTDRTENNQRGLNSTPQQPSRNGVQN